MGRNWAEIRQSEMLDAAKMQLAATLSGATNERPDAVRRRVAAGRVRRAVYCGVRTRRLPLSGFELSGFELSVFELSLWAASLVEARTARAFVSWKRMSVSEGI